MKPVRLNSRISLSVITLLIIISEFSYVSSQETWAQVPSPDPSTTRNLLRSISGTSSSDIWTVGEYEQNFDQHNLIMHWNGSGWQLYPGTDLGSNYNILWGVTAITSNDVWAAGTYNEPGTSRSQLIHWNGTNWSHTLLPDIVGGSFLFDIDAISTNDIWAVGGQAGSPTDPAYAIHYDGSGWTEFPAESPGSYSDRFYSVDGISSDDVWAVGRQSDSYGDFHAMAQHWDGSSWTNISLPPEVLSPLGDLSSVTMISSDDVWALGSTITGGILMIHWDGTEWIAVNNENSAGGAIASRASDLFALGGWISQWDGANWTVIDSLSHLAYPSLACSVTFSNGDIWAAGINYDSAFHTLVYRNVSNPLPVLINHYSVRKTGTTATMEWGTSSEFNTHEFIMERSNDKVSFIAINQIAAEGNGNNYILVDPGPGDGWNYYRLKVIDNDGFVTIYPIKSLYFDNTDPDIITVYPNPVTGRELSVRVKDNGNWNFYLYDPYGQEVKRWMNCSATSSINLSLPENLIPGTYILTLVNGIEWRSEKIFIQ